MAILEGAVPAGDQVSKGFGKLFFQVIYDGTKVVQFDLKSTSEPARQFDVGFAKTFGKITNVMLVGKSNGK
jgi:hypothetical protein